MASARTRPYVPQPGYGRTMIREIPPTETGLAFHAMRALRPDLKSEAAFATHVDDVLRPEGYRLAGAFEDGTEHAVAVAGFRVMHLLAWGGAGLYVDDLSTLPEARRRGHARALLDWLLEEARRLGCVQVHLDSAVGPTRADAHRLYMNAGLQIVAFHFTRGT
jgi:GNAT superfamily N-acetyltransferase